MTTQPKRLTRAPAREKPAMRNPELRQLYVRIAKQGKNPRRPFDIAFAEGTRGAR